MKQIVPIAIFIVAVGFTYFYVWPEVAGAGGTFELQSEISKLNDAIDTSKQVGTILSSLQSSIDSITPQQKTMLDRLLPNMVDPLQVGNDIENLSKSYGASLVLNSFGRAQAKGSDSGGGKYKTQSYSFAIAAPYGTYRDFLNKIEASLQLFDIQNMTISPKVGGMYQYDFTVSTYSINGEKQ